MSNKIAATKDEQQSLVVKMDALTLSNDNEELPAAIRIVGLSNEKIQFNLNPLFEILETIGNSPFVVYSVNGNSRTGKSLMCNFWL